MWAARISWLFRDCLTYSLIAQETRSNRVYILFKYARACYTGLPGMYPGIDHNPLDHMLPRHSMIVLLCVSCTRIDRHRSKYTIPQQGADPKAHILAAIHFHMAHFLRLLLGF